MKALTIGKALAAMLLFVCPTVHAAAPVVSNVTVTDVTPVSFSVVWAADQPSTPNLNVFVDAGGTTPAAGISVAPTPIESGDSAIATAAENLGVMKVRVTGLLPDSIYYFQTKTTSKGNPGDQTLYPAAAPMAQVTTESRVVRFKTVGTDEVPFTNDLIALDCDVAGALLMAQVQGSAYPVSSFAGDGVAAPFAYVDLNNVFSNAAHENLALGGGESLVLKKVKGIQGIESANFAVPTNTELAQLKAPAVALCPGDLNGDKMVDGDDLVLFKNDWGKADCGGAGCLSDLDGDGDADGLDLFALVNNWGNTCP
jgi:hypothetical protein